MEVARGIYGLQATPAAKGIIKIFLVYFFLREAASFLLISMN